MSDRKITVVVTPEPKPEPKVVTIAVSKTSSTTKVTAEEIKRSLDNVVAEVNRQLARAEDATQRADGYRLEAGKLLRFLRHQVEQGLAGENVSWWEWYAPKFTRSRKDAEKLMRLAGAENPDAAIEAERAAQKIRNDRKPRIGAVTAPTMASPSQQQAVIAESISTAMATAVTRKVTEVAARGRVADLTPAKALTQEATRPDKEWLLDKLRFLLGHVRHLPKEEVIAALERVTKEVSRRKDEPMLH
jgi:hypothetical protein